MAPPSPIASESIVETQERVQKELSSTTVDILNRERAQGFPSRTGNIPGSTEATRAPSTQPVTAAGEFVDAVNKKAEKKIRAKRESLLSAPDNFDTQLDLQYGALTTALLDGATALTPKQLRWLNPQQQAAIRSGDENLIKTARAGINAISQQ